MVIPLSVILFKLVGCIVCAKFLTKARLQMFNEKEPWYPDEITIHRTTAGRSGDYEHRKPPYDLVKHWQAMDSTCIQSLHVSGHICCAVHTAHLS